MQPFFWVITNSKKDNPFKHRINEWKHLSSFTSKFHSSKQHETLEKFPILDTCNCPISFIPQGLLETKEVFKERNHYERGEGEGMGGG